LPAWALERHSNVSRVILQREGEKKRIMIGIGLLFLMLRQCFQGNAGFTLHFHNSGSSKSIEPDCSWMKVKIK
jgi:hypothetical protein